MRLSEHLQNVYSQNGEDGALAKLFEVVRLDSGYFVEFGAWDGCYLSNTFALAEKGWHGCLIEGEPQRFEDLILGNSNPRVVKVCKFVETERPELT